MWKATLLLFFFLLARTARSQSPKAKAEEDLRQSLLHGYDKKARPDGKTVINFNSMNIQNFDMHEADHSMNIMCWMGYTWEDPRLIWKPEDHLEVTHIGISPDELWQPDISVYNAAAADKIGLKSQMPMLIYPDGKILFVPAHQLHLSCVMDLTYWPHDAHNCSLKLGSWIHSGHLMDLSVENFKIEVEIPISNSVSGGNVSRTEWNISKTSAIREVKYYPCCEEPYVDILISLIITRNAPAYAWTIKVPAACLSILTVVIFLLPPGAGEKLIFGGLLLLLDLLFIDYTSGTVNHAPSHTPLIVQLVSQQVVIVMVSVIVSAIVVRFSRDPHSSGLPGFLKGPVTGLSYILCLGNYANLNSGAYSSFARTMKADEVELGDECNGDVRKRENLDGNEWLILGAVVDRLALILYLAICIISLIRFSSVL